VIFVIGSCSSGSLINKKGRIIGSSALKVPVVAIFLQNCSLVTVV
jgi:hypothetical protein